MKPTWKFWFSLVIIVALGAAMIAIGAQRGGPHELIYAGLICLVAGFGYLYCDYLTRRTQAEIDRYLDRNYENQDDP